MRIESGVQYETKEMYRTTDFSLHSSNILHNTGVWSLTELASLYTVPLSAVNGLSRLTTTNNGQAWFESAHHFRIESERPIRIRIESRSFAGPY